MMKTVKADCFKEARKELVCVFDQSCWWRDGERIDEEGNLIMHLYDVFYIRPDIEVKILKPKE